MKLKIDTDICVGHGLCYRVAPQLFSDDEAGYAQIIVHNALTEEQLDMARAAIAACPERAISLEDS
jgi:ferredoxin